MNTKTETTIDELKKQMGSRPFLLIYLQPDDEGCENNGGDIYRNRFIFNHEWKFATNEAFWLGWANSYEGGCDAFLEVMDNTLFEFERIKPMETKKDPTEEHQAEEP